MRLVNRHIRIAATAAAIWLAASSCLPVRQGSLVKDDGPHAGTFYIKNGKLYDKTDREFIIRGVNNTHNYFPNKAYDALDLVKQMGFNTERVVWCADAPNVPARCAQKDMHTPAELERILERLRSLKIVAILSLQNATGSSNTEFLKNLTSFFVQNKALLNTYKDMVLLNIANEWYVDTPLDTYVAAYREAITTIRAAQLPHVLVIDVPGWGQNTPALANYYRTLQAVDPNLLFSAHMYELFADARAVKAAFESVRANTIPFLVGEFACTNNGQVADCKSVIAEASVREHPYGFIGWSVSGNTDGSLDIVSASDWKTLTPEWGKILVEDTNNGVRNVAQPACLFGGDTQNCGTLKNTPNPGMPSNIPVPATATGPGGYPFCRTPGVDSDGDGYGWDLAVTDPHGGHSCLQAKNSGTASGQSSADRYPLCTNNSNTGDGYGWDTAVTDPKGSHSCVVPRTSPTKDPGTTAQRYPPCSAAVTSGRGGYGWDPTVTDAYGSHSCLLGAAAFNDGYPTCTNNSNNGNGFGWDTAVTDPNGSHSCHVAKAPVPAAATPAAQSAKASTGKYPPCTNGSDGGNGFGWDTTVTDAYGSHSCTVPGSSSGGSSSSNSNTSGYPYCTNGSNTGNGFGWDPAVNDGRGGHSCKAP